MSYPSMTASEKPEIIDESWKRCHQFGLKPADPVNDQMITGRRVREMVQENDELVRHAIPIFEKLFPLINQSVQIALLIDKHGNIIHTAGDPQFANQAQKVQLQVGANWHEKNKGTNAIGVALVENKPVRIHAEQHFYAANRFLTCASSPIYAPTGELIGIINISGSKEQYNPHSLSLACMAADSLQNRLLIEQAKQEHLITLKELDITMNQLKLPLFSLDRDHRIIRANESARLILGKDCVGKELSSDRGFAIQTISDNTSKTWRSVAFYKPNEKQTDNPLYTLSDIAGSCPGILRMKELAQKAALTDFPVLLFGESGTGKELLAQSIHTSSPRVNRPFIAVNCSAIPESLVESELFGYERGAFTGANREGSIGKFEAANGGTLFLDEIGDMSLRAQAALLRVLQERTITPVGSVKKKPVNVRIIAATHRNLLKEINAGRFRTDLYYRLKGIQITLPALRERSDILEIAEHLLKKMNYPAGNISKKAKEMLLKYAWPGNVRELNSVLMQASFLAEGGEIEPGHLQFENYDQTDVDGAIPNIQSIKEAEIAAIRKTLQESGWNISKAAKLLQIGRNTLYRKMQAYHITN